MLERLRQYSVIYAVALVLFFLFWVFPPWLAAVWPLFSQEPFPLWLANQGWIGMSRYLSAVLLAVATLSALGLLGVILYAVRQHRQEVRWLEDVASEDDDEIEQRVHVLLQSAEIVPHLDAVEPYLDLRVLLQNVSIYTLNLDHLEGNFDFLTSIRRYVLKDAPQLTNHSREVRHAQPYKLNLRQFVQPDTAKKFLKDDAPGIGGGNVAVWWTYRNQAGEKKSVRIPLYDLRCTIKAK